MLTVIISARHQECSVFIVSGQSPLPAKLSLSFDQMIFINFLNVCLQQFFVCTGCHWYNVL